MIVAGHQPEYLPYIGFFHKVMHCDTFVIVDHIQFNKKSWQNRNRIRTKEGWILLTVPVLTKAKFEQRISEVRINNALNWGKKHWRSIYLNYGKAPFFNAYRNFFEQLYAQKWERLVDLDEAIIKYIIQELRIEVKVFKSSDFNPQGQKTDLLIDMCKQLSADTYLSGEGGHIYVDEAKFREQNLSHIYQDFHHPTYTQQFEPFIPRMSVIDLMFNHGNERSKEIILSSGGISK
jgi:hypothetical protein